MSVNWPEGGIYSYNNGKNNPFDESSTLEDTSFGKKPNSERKHSPLHRTKAFNSKKNDEAEYVEAEYVVFEDIPETGKTDSKSLREKITSFCSAKKSTDLKELKNNESFKAKHPKAYKFLLITGIALLILGVIALVVGLSVHFTVGWQHLLAKGITVKQGLYLIAAPAAGSVILTTAAILLIKYLIKQHDLKKKGDREAAPLEAPKQTKHDKSCLPSWISKERFYR